MLSGPVHICEWRNTQQNIYNHVQLYILYYFLAGSEVSENESVSLLEIFRWSAFQKAKVIHKAPISFFWQSTECT